MFEPHFKFIYLTRNWKKIKNKKHVNESFLEKF